MDKIKYLSHLIAFAAISGMYVVGKIISNILR